MSWLFSRALIQAYENSHSSPEPVAEYSAATSWDGAPSAPLSVTPTPHKFSRNDKTMEPSQLSRFGLTCAALTESRGEALLTWFRADSRVRTYPLLAQVPASMASGQASGRSSHESLTKYSPATSSWKTAQLSLLAGSDEFSETWPRWGSMHDGECWEQPTQGLRTAASESGLWQTPVADDSVDRKRGKWNSRGEPKLSAQVLHPEYWPTPTVCGNYNRKGASKTSGDGLATAVAAHSLDGQEIQQKRLNPEWVEWLMGWPIGWTDLKPLEMARFHEWQRQHSPCSTESKESAA